MLLLTANESKHLAWVSRPIKNLLAHGIHLLFVLHLLPPPLFLSFSLSFSLSLSLLFSSSPSAARGNVPLSQISVSVMPLVNYRLVLPFRRASATFIWPARSGIYRVCEFRRAADLSNYTGRPLSALAISVPRLRVTDAAADERGEHRLNALVHFVPRSGKELSGAIIGAD